MSFQDLACDLWSTNLAALDEQTFFIAELIYGHLIEHFSTPASFTTWPERIPRRIQNLLRRVASFYPNIKPSVAIHAMLVVLSIKEFRPRAVAFHDDVELLYMLAYKASAEICDPNFTVNAFMLLTDGRYFGTKLHGYLEHLRKLTMRSVHVDYAPLFTLRVNAVMKYHLSPYLPEGMKPYAGEIPMMSLSVPLERHGPVGNKQALVFPDRLHKLSRSTRIAEVKEVEEKSPNEVLDDAASQASSSVVFGLPDSASSSTIATESESSFDDSLDDDSRTVPSSSASSSLATASGSAAMGPAGGSKFVEKPHLVRCVDIPTSGADMDAESLGSSSSSSTLSTSPSEGRVKHNPASQLDAVFATRERYRSTIRSAAYSSDETADDAHDPFPDLFPNFRAEAREWESQPEPLGHRAKLSPMLRFRLWRATRRGRKAFASGSTSGSHIPSLEGSEEEMRHRTAEDPTKLWNRQSRFNRWKRALLVPMADC